MSSYSYLGLVTLKQVNLFNNIYDRSKCLQSFTNMQKLGTHEIRVNDLVAVDYNIFRCGYGEDSQLDWNANWKYWRLMFDFHTVTLLHVGLIRISR